METVYIVAHSYQAISPYVGAFETLEKAEASYNASVAEGRKVTLRKVYKSHYGTIHIDTIRDTDND